MVVQVLFHLSVLLVSKLLFSSRDLFLFGADKLFESDFKYFVIFLFFSELEKMSPNFYFYSKVTHSLVNQNISKKLTYFCEF